MHSTVQPAAKSEKNTCAGNLHHQRWCRADSVDIWNLYSIVYMEYPGYIPIIYRETIYLRYIPGIYPHDKSYLSVGFNACIACLGCALWYTQVFKDWRSSMLKIQSSNHFYGICLEYIILRPVYYFHIYNSGLVLVNSQNNLEADS
jgi:hypothetical protein